MSTYLLDRDNKGRGLATAAIAVAETNTLSSAYAHVCAERGVSDDVARFLKPKSAVGAGSASGAWNALVHSSLADDLLTHARPKSIVETLSAQMRRVEPLTRVVVEIDSSIVASWTAEGKAKALGSGAFDTAIVDPHKLSTLVVLTEELLRSRSAETAVRDVMSYAITKAQDSAFLDDAPADGSRPAGILNGITATPSSGSVTTDVATLIANFTGNLQTAVLITTPATGAAIGLQNSFLDAGSRGGSVAGLPLLVTNHLAADSSGDLLVLLDPSQVLIALGDVELSSAKSATVLMDDAPSMDSVAPVGTTVVSLFQTDSTGLRIERFISWQLARAGAVAAISAVNYAST